MAKLPPLRVTTTVINLVRSLAAFEEMLNISHAVYEKARDAGQEKNLVRFTQSRLGKQTRTFVGEFRYYLWEYPSHTLWVANGKGFVVEVLPTLTPVEAMAAYRGAFSPLLEP
jgi:hypothetical protein